MEIGYEICEAANGREALQVMEAEKNSVTVVLADWNMPEVNGFELLQQLRRRSELSAVKIIMVTTEAELGHMASALEAGADEYVMKPFTRDIIRDKLDLVGVLPQVSA